MRHFADFQTGRLGDEQGFINDIHQRCFILRKDGDDRRVLTLLALADGVDELSASPSGELDIDQHLIGAARYINQSCF